MARLPDHSANKVDELLEPTLKGRLSASWKTIVSAWGAVRTAAWRRSIQLGRGSAG